MAQVWSCPAPAALKGAPMVIVVTGESSADPALPVPRSPCRFSPQHQSVPSLLRAQLCCWESTRPSTAHAPASAPAAPPRPPAPGLPPEPVPTGPHTSVVTGLSFGVALVPSPSCPPELPPQQRTAPSRPRTHVNEDPTATLATSDPATFAAMGSGMQAPPVE